MDKPFTLKVQDIQEEIVRVINSSQLPVYVLKIIFQGIYKQLEEIESEEIANYEKTQDNAIINTEDNNSKKESDK